MLRSLRGIQEERVKPNYQHCTNCRWFVEVVGISRNHPLRCAYQHMVKGGRMLETLPERKWCMYYASEDGMERMMPLEVEA